MASSRASAGYDGDGRKDDDSRPDGTNRLSESDQSTLDLVQKLKRKIQDKSRSNQFNNKENTIEKEVAKIRCEKNREIFRSPEWQDALPEDLKNCPDRVLHLSMAYGDDAEQLIDVIRAKMSKLSSNPKEDENEKSPIKPLDKIKTSLEQINRNLKSFSVGDLFRTVLELPDNQIDYADRVFYSEARRLIENLHDYTFENAHDQVQAIRLLHFEAENSEADLIDFVRKCRNFKDAHSYLQKLARKQIERSTNRPPSSGTRSSTASGNRRSIIRKSSNDDNNIDNNDPSSSGCDNPLYNSTRNNPSSDRESLRNGDNEEIEATMMTQILRTEMPIIVH